MARPAWMTPRRYAAVLLHHYGTKAVNMLALSIDPIGSWRDWYQPERFTEQHCPHCGETA